MELHLPVQRRGVNERVLGAEVDAATVLLEYVAQIIFLGAAQVLLQRHLVIVCAADRLEVLALSGARQIDLANDRARRAENRALEHVAELAHVAGPAEAHELRERLVRDAGDAALARHLAVA